MAAVLPNAVGAQAAAPAEPGKIGILSFLTILAQLGVLTLVLRQFQIEGAAFLQLWVLALFGFSVHAFLPLRLRLPFFLVLSLAGIALVLGFANGAWLVSIGLVLIALCHLPLPFSVRIALLAAVGGVLITQRAQWMPAPWPEAIWPILGSMFMFRLIVYLYDLRHEKVPASPVRALSYFFMLPNVCFPLFPVVDYKTFRRNYYDDDAYRIYQTGIDWIVRGVIHLLLYRLVNYHLTLAPEEVTSPELLLQYLVANFVLYFKVSGLFHLIVGMLYLFGFRLPETHNRYFLAAGFTDFWRRINIYWKDFMQKVFYYPAVFALRKFGTHTAIVGAMLWVFLLTWFLHAYQWFWIRGTTLFVLQDIVFWVIIGVLVIATTLYEMKYGRKRSLGKPKFSWRAVGVLTLKSYATFWFICVLWSFWTSEHLDHWQALWRALSGEYTAGILIWPVISLLVIFIGNIPVTKAGPANDTRMPGHGWIRDRAMIVGTMVLLVAFSLEPVFSRFGPEFATAMHSLRSGSLSRIDTAKMERGYYESLTDVSRFNSQLWEVYAKKPHNWLDVENAGLKRFVGGFVQNELIPSYVSSTKYGTVTINRWGMRDQHYAEYPGPQTFRAVLLGASSLMGWGVADGATFEALLENRLNRELSGAAFVKYELLNFGVPGYYPPQQLVAVERALRMHPHAVMFIATGREQSRSVHYLAEVVRKGLEIPFPSLQELVVKAGVHSGMNEIEVKRRLMPYSREILLYVYMHIAERAKGEQMKAIWVFLPQLREGSWQEETADAIKSAEAAGFSIINLSDVFNGKDPVEDPSGGMG